MLAAARARGDRAAELDTLLALARAHYVRSLDEQEYAAVARSTYEETYALAVELGDRKAMVEALLPTAWFTDYWVDYAPTARANVEEAAQARGGARRRAAVGRGPGRGVAFREPDPRSPARPRSCETGSRHSTTRCGSKSITSG